MNLKRLEMLRKFVEEDPSDPFNLYALALELSSAQPAEAEKLWEELLQNHPDYLPAFYQAGIHWFNAGNLTKAKSIVEAGMAVAQRQKNLKTLSELRSLYDEIE